MKPLLSPEWGAGILAKSPEKGEGGEAETLAQHTWAVLERLAEFIRLRPLLPKRLGCEDLWQLLYWATFLHDFGKAVPAFQNVLKGTPGAKEVWQKNRHEIFSLAFVEWISDGFAPQQLQWVVNAIVSHHKDPNEIQFLYPPLEQGEEDPLGTHLASFQPETLESLWKWIEEGSVSWISDLNLGPYGVFAVSLKPKEDAIAMIYGQGASVIRRYLSGYQRFIRKMGRQDKDALVGLISLRGHILNADHSASAHAGSLLAVDFLAENVLQKRKIRYENLFPHQRAAGQTLGSTLLIAPTGSGKTEAALLWASNQKSEWGRPSRLFYTLPYQTSMNAMFLRLQEVFGVGQVGLQHGRGLLALYRQLMDREDSPRKAAQIAKYLRNLSDLNHPPIRVFSPYQMLKWTYRLKGYEAQLNDYHDALFILDEIHAYEPKRLALIIKTVEYLHRHYNSRFFIMSATLPTLIKNWLIDALGDLTEITAKPEVFEQFKRHRINLVEGELSEPEWLEQVVRDLKSGKSVLVVCNVVARAQAVYLELKSKLQGTEIPILMIHGRFNMRDRSAKERLIQTYTGVGKKHATSILLVATQAIEVSLDIDLDTIYTDPAPLEALVQRFGRINRGRRLKEPALVHVFSQPDDGQKVYDPALITSALTILRGYNKQLIDEGLIGNWLDEIYTDSILRKWKEEYHNAVTEFEEVCINTLRPFATDPSLEEAFYRTFDGVEVLPEVYLDEYMRCKDEEPILANELLASISWRRYQGLLRKGFAIPGDRSIPPVVRTHYSSEMGLMFEAASEVDWE